MSRNWAEEVAGFQRIPNVLKIENSIQFNFKRLKFLKNGQEVGNYFSGRRCGTSRRGCSTKIPNKKILVENHGHESEGRELETKKVPQ